MKQLAHILAPACIAGLSLPSMGIAEEGKGFTLQDSIGSDDFKISGSFRARMEYLDGQFRPTGPIHDDMMTFRTIITAEYDFGPIRIGGQLRDSRAYLANAQSTISTSDVNALEPVQAYVAADLGDALGQGTDTSITAGRMILNLGAKRLMAESSFSNVTSAFTGVRADWKGKGKEKLTLFMVVPQERLPTSKADLVDNKVEWDREQWNQTVWGAYLTMPSLRPGVSADFYVLGLDEGDSARQSTRNRHLITPGLRLWSARKAGKLDFETELAGQFGNIRTSTLANAPRVPVRAYTAHAEAGYTFATGWSPRLAVQLDVASGDDAGSRSYNQFDNLYGDRRFEFGPTGLFGPLARANIITPGVRLEVAPDKRTDAFIAWRAVWLDSRTDAFARTGLKDATGNSGRYGGQQVEARIRYWLIPNQLQLDTGAAVLFKGRFLETAPGVQDRSNTRYAYFDLNWSF